MLRFVNAHRVASVGLLAALALVIMTMATRVGTEPDPDEFGPTEQPNTVDSPTPTAAETQSGLDAATQRGPARRSDGGRLPEPA